MRARTGRRRTERRALTGDWQTESAVFVKHLRQCVRHRQTPYNGWAIGSIRSLLHFRYFCAKEGFPKLDTYIADTPRKLAWYLVRSCAHRVPTTLDVRICTISSSLPSEELVAMYRMLRRHASYAELDKHDRHCGNGDNCRLCGGGALRARLRAAE
jgi:hypothetical protein